jgi:hypothetical protein
MYTIHLKSFFILKYFLKQFRFKFYYYYFFWILKLKFKIFKMIIDIYLIMDFFFITRYQNEFFNYYNLCYNSITYNYLEGYCIYFIAQFSSFN